jgi:hypothetical protein
MAEAEEEANGLTRSDRLVTDTMYRMNSRGKERNWRITANLHSSMRIYIYRVHRPCGDNGHSELCGSAWAASEPGVRGRRARRGE